MSENRMRDFKFKGQDANEMRGRRRDQGVELRKNRREESLLKKRNVDLEETTETSTPLSTQFGAVLSAPAASPGSKITVANLPELRELIKSGDTLSELQGTTRCRMLLSKERNPPIDEVIEYGLVPYFIMFLRRTDSPQLQFEAAWALTNIASGSAAQTKVVVENGAVPLFIALLGSPEIDVQEQAVWALGNIAGDGPELRNLCIKSGIIEPLVALIASKPKTTILRHSTWTLSNLCRGKKPATELAYAKALLPSLMTLLYESDTEVLADACWAASYVTDGDNTRISAVVSIGMVPRLVELLAHPDANVHTPSLRAVGNIVTGDDQHTQTVLNSNALHMLGNLFVNTTKETVRKEICWALSNVTAGTPNQIQAVIDIGLIPLVIKALRTGECKTRKEACWVVSNLTTSGDIEQIRNVVQNEGIQAMVEALGIPDVRTIGNALDSLHKMLEAGNLDDGTNPCQRIMEECGGLDVVEALQQHENVSIYEKAQKILEDYFAADEEEDDVAAASAVLTSFQSGVPSLSTPFAF